ncbi:hypothetical protein ABZ819_11350 [Streptomyces venezuelae]|uniref:hypothetical protein n=1 Tax=Streptomyces venezuelae TaxID=54571 RepID=UPI0034403F19
MYVITGRPAAGKSSWIEARGRSTGIVIDLARITQALTGPGAPQWNHQAIASKVALRVRYAAIDEALKHLDDTDVYAIHTMPSLKWLARCRRHGAQVVAVDPGKEGHRHAAHQGHASTRPSGCGHQVVPTAGQAAHRGNQTQTLAAASYANVFPFHFGQMAVKTGSFGAETALDGIRKVSCKIERPQEVEFYAGQSGLMREPTSNDQSRSAGTLKATTSPRPSMTCTPATRRHPWSGVRRSAHRRHALRDVPRRAARHPPRRGPAGRRRLRGREATFNFTGCKTARTP